MTPATQILLFGKPFRIADYFRMGQIGWHWQFDDPLKYVGPTYMYQDTAGTTPVTAVGQGIGLLLGREYGGYRGPNIPVNDVQAVGGSVTDNGDGTYTVPSGVTCRFRVLLASLTNGRSYETRFTLSGMTATSVVVDWCDQNSATFTTSGDKNHIGSRSTYDATSRFFDVAPAGGAVTIRITAVREIPGTHLTQATGTAKPTLSARVNLLTKTEQFDDAAWTKTDTTITADNTTAPNGTTTADLLTEGVAGTGVAHQGVTSVASAVYRARRVIKRGNHDWVMVGVADNTFANGVRQWINLATGAKGTQNTFGAGGATFSSCTVEDLGSGWYAVNLAGQIGASTVFRTYTHSAASDGSTVRVSGATRYEWGADLRTADDAAKLIPAYQRVGATATDHDTDGFPHFALADGTDDCWASVATVDGSGTDKLTHVTAITKASDAATAVVHEHGATVLSNVGTVLFQTAAATDWSINAYAGTLPGALVASPYAAPKTSVVAGVFDIASDLRQIHVDGVLKNTSNTDYGSGNFANETLYVLSRAGTSLRFNGRFYGSTGRFGPMGDSERNNLTRWWMKRIGAA